MPAFRGKNLRSGDLAESTGLLLLQQVALVAPVPRTEDVGIDAVVTLHREFDPYKLIADESFFVQIKSSSVTSIDYSAEEIQWLYKLEVPLFYASVDMQTCTVNLYCSQQLAEAFVTDHKRTQLTIQFDGKPDCLDLVEARDGIVRLGGPILSWSMTDCSKDRSGLRDRFYRVMKAHLARQRENLEFRYFGRVANYSWVTNEVPSEGLYKSKGRGKDEDVLNSTYEKMIPHFCAWIQELRSNGGWNTTRDVLKMLEDTRFMIERGGLRGDLKELP